MSASSSGSCGAWAGLEVAEVEYIGVAGAELPWDPEKLVIGNILEVRQHPNADRLVLADVDYGAGEPHTVVTGTPNLFQYKGLGRLTHPLKGVYAKEASSSMTATPRARSR